RRRGLRLHPRVLRPRVLHRLEPRKTQFVQAPQGRLAPVPKSEIALASCGTLFYWLPVIRCTSILSNEGCGSPLSVRFCDSQVNLLSSTFVTTFSAVER